MFAVLGVCRTRTRCRRCAPCTENPLVGGLPLFRFLVSVPVSEPIRSMLSIKILLWMLADTTVKGKRKALQEQRRGLSNIGEPHLSF